MKNADDTVLWVADKNIEIIESHLLDDFNLLAKWFKENELILNLKKEEKLRQWHSELSASYCQRHHQL